MEWSDEYSWSPLVQSTTQLWGGGLYIEIAERLAGRPYTLEGDEVRAWITRPTLDALKAWAATPGLALVLRLRGTDHNVVFDNEHAALEAQPVFPYIEGDDPDTTHYRSLRLRLLGI